VPVACLRTEGRHGAELATQGIMGTPLRVIGSKGEWLYVELPDGYRGYMIGNSLEQMSQTDLQAWKASPRASVSSMSAYAYSEPDTESEPLTPLQLADIVQVVGTSGEIWTKIMLPDGRKGYVDSQSLQEFKPFAPISGQEAIEQILSHAREMLGQEYLWGGTSAKGNDCSGFTRIVFQAAGYYLPRDAWQQAQTGIEIASLQEALPGDLLFFSNSAGKVIHVGIYIGGGEMIHSSGMVKINALKGYSPASSRPLYERTPSHIRRVTADSTYCHKANQLYF
jgi:cell wall-associated NlpC family hydrolase